jgi:hypothetical protein
MQLPPIVDEEYKINPPVEGPPSLGGFSIYLKYLFEHYPMFGAKGITLSNTNNNFLRKGNSA